MLASAEQYLGLPLFTEMPDHRDQTLFTDKILSSLWQIAGKLNATNLDGDDVHASQATVGIRYDKQLFDGYDDRLA